MQVVRERRRPVEGLVAEGLQPGNQLARSSGLGHEIQVLDGDRTSHGMGAVINETPSPYFAYNGAGKWNAYDITFRAARFADGKRTQPAREEQ